MLTAWSDSIIKFPLGVNDYRNIGVSPITFSEDVKKELTKSLDVKESQIYLDRLSQEITSNLESNLTQKLGLPVVPSRASITDQGGQQFIANIPQCLGEGNASFELPLPMHQISVSLELLKNAEQVTQTSRKVNINGQLIEQSIPRHEIVFGARYKLKVTSPDETSDGPIRIERLFKQVSSKSFYGQRTVQINEQYRKVTLVLANSIADQFKNPDEKWILNHLSEIEKNSVLEPVIEKKTGFASFLGKISGKETTKAEFLSKKIQNDFKQLGLLNLNSKDLSEVKK